MAVVERGEEEGGLRRRRSIEDGGEEGGEEGGWERRAERMRKDGEDEEGRRGKEGEGVLRQCRNRHDEGERGWLEV